MIRSRKPSMDDGRLFEMIRNRLIPIAREARPHVRFTRRGIVRRLNACRVLVACRTTEGPAIGFISFKPSNGILMVDMLAVDRTFEGKGIGSKLMDAAERHARRRGISLIRLAVDEPNIRAQSFYERKGFQVANYMPQHALYVLEKSIPLKEGI